MDDVDDHARSTRLLLAAPPVVGTQEWYDEGWWGAADRRRDEEKGRRYADYISTESGPPWSTMSTSRKTCFFEKNFSKSSHCWPCVFTM